MNKESLKRKDVGAMGVGAMIVFIAIVLVSGIAAAVLIQTANRLEIQAMQTGEETKSEVATGLAIIDIEGHAITGGINFLTITISPRAGSGDIDLNEVFVEISDGNRKNILRYGTNQYTYRPQVGGNIFNHDFFNDLTGQTFGILELIDADNSSTAATPVINRGDKVMILIKTNSTGALGRLIPVRTDILGMVQPEEGSAAVFSFRTPASYTERVFRLF